MIITKLHIRMAENRMNQQELAKVTGIRQPTISAYCRDKYLMINRDHLDIFCKLFKCKLEDIIEFVDDSNNEDKQ